MHHRKPPNDLAAHVSLSVPNVHWEVSDMRHNRVPFLSPEG